MTAKANTFEGGTDETAITAGNSGGGSGDAFDSDILNAVFDNARAAVGSFSCRLSVSATSSAYVSWTTTGSTWYMRAYVYLTSAPPLNVQILKPMSGSTIRAMVRIMTDRTVQVTDSGFTSRGQSTTVLSLNAWYRIEAKFVVGTSTAGLVTVRIFATPNGTTPTETVTATSMTISSWDRVRFAGDFSSTTTYSLWQDGVAISDVDWIGPISTSINATAGRVTGTGMARPVAVSRNHSVARVTGTGTAQPVTTTQVHVVGRVETVGEAMAVSPFKSYSGIALFPTLSIQAAFSVGATTSTMLTLDDPTRGHLDTGTLGDGSEEAPTWMELADRAVEGQGSIARGSQRIDSPIISYEPGTLSVPLANRDRDLDPSNLNGPYTGDSGMLDGTRTVLNTDGGFEDGLDDWNAFGGVVTVDSTHVHSGGFAGKFVPDGTSELPFLATQWVEFTALQTYEASAWVWCTEACTVFAAIHWYNAAVAFISQTVSIWTVPAGTWTKVTVTGLAPAGATQGPMLITIAGTPAATNVMWVDDAEVAHLPYAPATQITAMRAVRVRATWANVVYELFQGTADQWAIEYHDPDQAVTLLTATDGFKVLAGISRSASPVVGDGETSGDRMNRILDSAGWGDEERVIDDGDAVVQGSTLEGEVLGELQLTADSEIGELYVDGGGRVRFRARNALLIDARSNTPQAVFGDAGDELPYKDLGVATDDATFYNEVRVTRAARADQEPADEPVEQVAADTASQARFYKRTFTPSSPPILDADDDALTYAQWLVAVSSQPELRFTELVIEPAVAPNDLWPQALGRQIGDRITIIRRPPGGGDPIEMDCFIRGIEHTFGGEEWTTKWALQSATRYGGFLVLDDLLLGRLDYNRLAY